MNDLFKLVVPKLKICESFKSIIDNNGEEPTRYMMNEVFSRFNAIDKNFIEQFQTTGFDARCFELYLYAVFESLGFKIDRKNPLPYPDYILEKCGIRVSVEATTSNPVNNKKVYGKFPSSLDVLFEKINNEYPIKLGSSIYSKEKKKYWDLEYCKNTPFVIAIEDFHESSSLKHSFGSLLQYLYGIRYSISEEGDKVIVSETKIKEHKLGDKTVESGYFEKDTSSKISAVLFSNAGTTGKFKRMGYIKGYHYGNIQMKRKGNCHNYKDGAVFPNRFSYNLDYPMYNETWKDEAVLCINPNADCKLPVELFEDIPKVYLVNKQLHFEVQGFYPYMSETFSFITPLSKNIPIYIKQLMKYERNKMISYPDETLFTKEVEWYTTVDRKKLGIVLLDKSDKNYSIVILNKDSNEYKYEISKIDLADIKNARKIMFECLKI